MLVVFLVMFLTMTFKMINGNWWLLGYVYARPSVFFAGIETKDFWRLDEDSLIYCGTTTNGEYFIVLMDKIFVGEAAKTECLDP